MRFLLLGGIGYLGGRLTQFLKSQGHRVVVTTRRKPEDVPAWVCADRIEQVDWSSVEHLKVLAEDTDVAIHLVAADQDMAAKDPPAAMQASVSTVWRLMEATGGCARPPAVIYVSTWHVYGRMDGIITEASTPAPAHPYALAKRFGEEVIEMVRRQRPVHALCVRLANGFGCPPGMEVSQWSLAFNDFCRQAVEQKVIVLKSAARNRRDFVTLGDVARALEFLAARPDDWPADGIMHIGSSISLSIPEAAEIVAQRASVVLGYRPEIRAPQGIGAVYQSLTFSVDRLAGLGFTWSNLVEEEIDATLRLCVGALDR